MQITVFGANGKVGSLVVEQALEQGYEVVAFVHRKSQLPPHAALRIVKGDIYDAATVATAIKGSTVIISALSSWGTPEKDVLSAAVEHIIPAMKVQGTKRIISLTGSDARASGDVLTPLHRLSHGLIKLVPGVRKVLADGEQHIQLLEAGGLDWTVVRSPVMNKRGDIKHCRLTSRRSLPWATINRHSVAQSLVGLVEDDSYNGQAPFIVRT